MRVIATDAGERLSLHVATDGAVRDDALVAHLARFLGGARRRRSWSVRRDGAAADRDGQEGLQGARRPRGEQPGARRCSSCRRIGLARPRSEMRLLPMLRALTAHHAEHCPPYRNVVDRVFGGADRPDRPRLEDVPFLPGLAVQDPHALRSVPESEVLKVLTSSGTTGQQPSRVFLDAETASVQSAVLVKVAQHFLGKERLPMVILDHAGVVRDRRSFSARGAGILGMAQFGHRPFYALREDMSLDEEGLRAYLEQAAGRRVLLFGFTFMVWQYLVQALERTGRRLDLPRRDTGPLGRLEEAAGGGGGSAGIPRAGPGGHGDRAGDQLLRHGRAGRRRVLRESESTICTPRSTPR